MNSTTKTKLAVNSAGSGHVLEKAIYTALPGTLLGLSAIAAGRVLSNTDSYESFAHDLLAAKGGVGFAVKATLINSAVWNVLNVADGLATPGAKIPRDKMVLEGVGSFAIVGLIGASAFGAMFCAGMNSTPVGQLLAAGVASAITGGVVGGLFAKYTEFTDTGVAWLAT